MLFREFGAHEIYLRNATAAFSRDCNHQSSPFTIRPSKEGIVNWSRTTFHFPHAIPRGYQGKCDRPTRARHMLTTTMEHTCNQSFWSWIFCYTDSVGVFLMEDTLRLQWRHFSRDLNHEALLYNTAFPRRSLWIDQGQPFTFHVQYVAGVKVYVITQPH